jgi:hypothetical protein
MKIVTTRKDDWTAVIRVTASTGEEYVFTLERDTTHQGFYFATINGEQLLPRLLHATEEGCLLRVQGFVKQYIS